MKSGRFSLALFTMIQITSGDGWISNIVRPMHTNEVRAGGSSKLEILSLRYICIVGIPLSRREARNCVSGGRRLSSAVIDRRKTNT